MAHLPAITTNLAKKDGGCLIVESEVRENIQDSGYVSSEEAARLQPDEETYYQKVQESLQIHQAGQTHLLDDDDIADLVHEGHLQTHALEKVTRDTSRAVGIRRSLLVRAPRASTSDTTGLHNLPWHSYDYDRTHGCCAENVIGFMPIPVGIAGPLVIDGERVTVPMSTTEGTLIASTSRGCKALNAAGGATTELIGDAMTRAPVVQFDTIRQAANAKRFLDSTMGQSVMKQTFEMTTSHGTLLDVTTRMAGRHLYLRFRAQSGEAMGMNMLSKGSEAVLRRLRVEYYPEMRVISVSGNLCTDKKPSAINWIEGRGKSVVAEATIPAEVLSTVLKTSAEAMVELNSIKNHVGSALAGTASGGFNAHAANIVAAVFLATGQDPAQVVTSSNCLTMFECGSDGALIATVTMPSIEVGTIGGGTHLPAQLSMLEMMGCKEKNVVDGGNSGKLARIIAAAVLAGELSLCSALTTGDLVKSHMQHNRRT
ncbi:3-hydroxy-3-methylglutaryl-coenzyme A reductase 1 [Elsinoe fawcettii]|nr:3-hydroxy-3-methylglutaryl-coenzyme A reductase 1 [Elsinoe fawcettii]